MRGPFRTHQVTHNITFSEFKEICLKISSYGHDQLYWYFEQLCGIDEVWIDKSGTITNQYASDARKVKLIKMKYNHFTRGPEELFFRYIETLKYLEANRFVSISPPEGPKYNEEYYLIDDNHSHVSPLKKLNDEMRIQAGRYILPFPKLYKFIDNGFKTDEEIRFEIEVQRDNQTRRNTIITQLIASISILLNIYLVINYTTEREVKINNPVDTVNVKLITEPTNDPLDNVEIDSSIVE